MLQHNLLWRQNGLTINPFISSRLVSRDNQFIKRLASSYTYNKLAFGWVAWGNKRRDRVKVAGFLQFRHPQDRYRLRSQQRAPTGSAEGNQWVGRRRKHLGPGC